MSRRADGNSRQRLRPPNLSLGMIPMTRLRLHGDLALLTLLALVQLPAMAEEPGDAISVSPQLISSVLLNPGKGWVLYGMASWQDPKALAIGALGYHRFAWSQIEPREGEYAWSVIDDALSGWSALGKTFAFGVMCANSHSGDPYVTPKWVFDAGAACRLIDMKTLANPYAGTPGVKAVPEFNNPVFLAKLAAFLTALGKRYDGDPRIAFIDIRSYGNWGEGHMYPFGGHELTVDEFRHHVQLHLDAFKRTRLCISAEAKAHAAVYDWAVAQGVAARRDGICGNSDGSEVLRAFGHAPGVFEFYGTYTWMKEKGWWDGSKSANGEGHLLLDCVQNGKPSYIGLSQGGAESLAFLAAERPLIDLLANRMGYHVALTRAVVPARLARGQEAHLELTWSNDGVAPIYVPAAVALALYDDAGQLADIAWPEQSHPADWRPDHQTTEAVTLRFPQAPPGTYHLMVGVVAKRGDPLPSIALAIAGRTAGGWYPLSSLVVTQGARP